MGRFVAKPVIPKRSGGLPGGTLREHRCWRSLPDITFGPLARDTQVAQPFAACRNGIAVGNSCRVTPRRSPSITAFPGPHHPVYSHPRVLVTEVLL